jgi:CxxC motif-containing protein (DUF1111 family)
MIVSLHALLRAVSGIVARGWSAIERITNSRSLGHYWCTGEMAIPGGAGGMCSMYLAIQLRFWQSDAPLIAVMLTFSASASICGGDDAVSKGEKLFIKQFAVGSSEPNKGDGLGPLFNHVSCAACHRQGALGGGGSAEFNVNLLSAQLDSNGSRPDHRLLLITLRSLHPAFVGEGDRIVPNILLHRFGPGERYFQFKAALGGQQIPLDPFPSEHDQLQAELTREPLPILKKGPIRLVRAQRNTTALFGSGLIDQIPDRLLHDLAKLQTKLGRVSGRVPPIGPDRVGRFGWRGQQEHLHDFVLGACANELGLEVPGTPQPLNPLQPKYRPGGLDLSAEQCASLTAFVAALPAPREIEPSIRLRDSRNQGKVLFASLGCGDCHVEQVGEVAGLYSDLLLHDMGPKLADPVMAEASLTYIRRLPDDQRSQPEPQPPATYYGGSSFQDLAVTGPRPSMVEAKDRYGVRNLYSVEKTNFESEWRTPPLWGVADSAPYLHDGRAPTLVEAILWHGGEADSAVDQFKRLELADRLHLLTFLRSLRAP